MNYLNIKIIVLSSIFLLVFSSCGKVKKDSTESVTQQDTVNRQGERNIIFENEYAMVVKIKLAPGEFISPPSGEGKDRVIYSLSDYTIDWEEQGKKLGTKSWKKGDVHFHEAGKHAAKNNGTTTAEWIVFAMKNTDLADCGDNTVENDVNSVSPDYAQTLFDNDEFRVTQVKLPKGQSIPAHSGVNRAVYSLSNYELIYESNAEVRGEKQFKAGDVHWHQACMHSLENDGETEAEFLVVSYKRKDN